MQQELPYSRVHHILAHSYLFYFVLFIAGVILDVFFRIKVFNNATTLPVGLGFLVLSSLLIIWAQNTSRNLSTENISKETFCRGPYCYTRTPTHWGLFLLLLGFGIIANAFFILLFTLISFIVTKFFFIKKQEQLLAEKYGTPYLEYKEKVKL